MTFFSSLEKMDLVEIMAAITIMTITNKKRKEKQTKSDQWKKLSMERI